MNKVISPDETYRAALRKIHSLEEPIFDMHYEIKRPSKIPQYRFIGTQYFTQYTTSTGSNGKGHTKEQALASGIMELAERYSCYKYLSRRDVYKIRSFQSNEETNQAFQLKNLYESSMDGMFKNIPLHADFLSSRVRWYQASSLNGDSVWLPAALIKILFHG